MPPRQFEAPLTYRHEALRITFLTAHKARDAESVDWSVLTDRKMTIVVYMGMTAAPSVRAGLLAAGRSPKTPVGMFARVTRPDAQAVVGKLEDLPALAEKVDGGPAILIIGDVVAHSAPWRQSNPNQLLSELSGCCRMTSPLATEETQDHRPLGGHRQPHLAMAPWSTAPRDKTGRPRLSDAAVVRTSDDARALLAEGRGR